jgi:hypothetical protein
MFARSIYAQAVSGSLRELIRFRPPGEPIRGFFNCTESGQRGQA